MLIKSSEGEIRTKTSDRAHATYNIVHRRTDTYKLGQVRNKTILSRDANTARVRQEQRD